MHPSFCRIPLSTQCKLITHNSIFLAQSLQKRCISGSRTGLFSTRRIRQECILASLNRATKRCNSTESAQVVTPWEVHSDSDTIDYNRLVEEFGTQLLTEQHVKDIEEALKRGISSVHPLIRRQIFFSHRSIHRIITSEAEQKPHYLYTGRGPSSSAMHLGHLIPFWLTKWWSDAFGVPVVIQMTDDEKFLWKKHLDIKTVRRYTIDNAKDIIATGFSKDRTFIFSNLDHMAHLYPNILRIQRAITFNQVRGCFGFTNSDNIGKISFPAIQAAPSFPSTFKGILREEHTLDCEEMASLPENQQPPQLRCLIPCAIDQDPYFRMTRELAPRIGYKRPALLLSQFFPALQGPQSKMSASDPNSSIYLTDSKKELRKKVMKYAFSGGRSSLEEHRELGGRPNIDVSFQYLRFFLDSDEKLQEIHDNYLSGQLLSGELKQILVDTLTPILEKHQERRSKIHDDDVREFMAVRELRY